jgi:8-oxo-dGTP pyrophosphatase MutT (NUDIX family)
MYIGAGILLRNGRGQILLVCDAKSGRWGFPKGHPEQVDKKSPLSTAVRECWEETGLTAGQDYLIETAAPKRIGKRLYFHARSVRDTFEKPAFDKNEIRDVAWWNMEDFVGRDDILNSDLRCWLKKKVKSPFLGGHRPGAEPSSLAI